MSTLESAGGHSDAESQIDETDSIMRRLRGLSRTSDSPASVEEETLFFRLFGLDRPSDDRSIPAPSEMETARLKIWVENPKSVTESEQIAFFRACHYSKTWRTAAFELLRECVLKTDVSQNEGPSAL